MARLKVTNIQRLCVNDGPGIRTTVFLKGCALSCPWCCNPETINRREDGYFYLGGCKQNTGNPLCLQCEKEGGDRPFTECPYHCYEATYKTYTDGELCEALSDGWSPEDGGITISGGEPMLWAAELEPLLQNLKSAGTHIAVETSLFAPFRNIAIMMRYIDYWLIDLKFQYGFIRNKEEHEEVEWEHNLRSVQSVLTEGNYTYRMVVFREMLDKTRNIICQLKANSIKEIELLNYHSLAENKYSQLGKRFTRFEPLSQEHLELIRDEFQKEKIETKWLTI